MGIPVTVVMPLTAPLMKITLCRQYGATVLVKGEDIGVVSRLCIRSWRVDMEALKMAPRASMSSRPALKDKILMVYAFQSKELAMKMAEERGYLYVNG